MKDDYGIKQSLVVICLIAAGLSIFLGLVFSFEIVGDKYSTFHEREEAIQRVEKAKSIAEAHKILKEAFDNYSYSSQG